NYASSDADIWLFDFSQNRSTRFTFNAPSSNPVWSPDGSRIVFTSRSNLYEKSVTGGADETLFWKSDKGKIATSWSRDGRFLLYTESGDVWLLSLQAIERQCAFWAQNSTRAKPIFLPICVGLPTPHPSPTVLELVRFGFERFHPPRRWSLRQ